MRLLESFLSSWRSGLSNGASGSAQLNLLAMQSARIPTYREALPELRHELSRARRYMRPISMMMVSPVTGIVAAPGEGKPPTGVRSNGKGNGHRVVIEEGPFDGMASLASLLMGAVLRDDLRESDRVFYLANRNCHCILMAESGLEQAEQAAMRLNKLLRSRGGVVLRTGIAEFPQHGWTLEELIASAETFLQQNSGADLLVSPAPGGHE